MSWSVFRAQFEKVFPRLLSWQFKKLYRVVGASRYTGQGTASRQRGNLATADTRTAWIAKG